MCDNGEKLKPTLLPIKLPNKHLPLTKELILEAQRHTKSGGAAARFLGVHIVTYTKYARIYGIYESHKNQSGFGIRKGRAAPKFEMSRIFDGERPHRFNWRYFKRRLVEEGYFKEECGICGFNEINLNSGRVCLHVDTVNGDRTDLAYDNVRLLCLNCYVSNNGYLPASPLKIFCGW
jgi:hypothetical protein